MTVSGVVKKIDEYEKMLWMEDGTVIAIEELSAVEIPGMTDMRKNRRSSMKMETQRYVYETHMHTSEASACAGARALRCTRLQGGGYTGLL